MVAGRSPAVSGRRRSRNKGPPTPSSRPQAQELAPLPPGTEIEARIDDEGFYGSWFEATVVDFEPATGPRYPALYTVAYSHLHSEDGPEPVAATHVRSRPPPPPPPGSSAAAAPGFLLHDIVEAFDGGGWWSGIVFAPVPDLADPASTVTVAFPITREVMPFAPHLVRRRRDYVGGEWVPSLSVVAAQPKRGARIYKAGEKVEVLRDGKSWFPATVDKAVDRLSYIVEYPDEQEDGGKATQYLHFAYIRPAEYHRLRESKVQLGPGTAVEVHCDGAWSQGVVRRVVTVREGCEYEVSVNGDLVEQLMTKAAEQLRPLCIWNGKHWTIPTDDKGQHSSRQQYASRKQPISPADAASSDDEGLQRASVSETDATLSGSFKSLASNHCLNSCSLLVSEKNGLSVFPHRTLNTCSVSKNGLLSSPSVHAAPPDELMSNAIGETEFSQDVEMVLSDGQHKTLVCGRNADETCDMLLTPEVRTQNIASSLINQETQERPFFVRTLSVKKGITKNRRGETRSVVNRIPDVCTNTADTQVMKSNRLTDTTLQSHDRLVPRDGNQVDEGSILESLQNSGSSVFASDNILMSSFSSGSSMPSDLAFSPISGHQVPFVKRSPAWRLMDGMDVFKEVPQQPHFHPLRQFLPALREGMALGLMVTFASSVEDIRQSSIADCTASLQEKIATLRHLEEHGFSVQFLRCRLVKLLQIKSDHSNYLAEKEHLKAQLLEKTSSLSQIDERLEKKEHIIAELEEELRRTRLEAQKIMEEKEHEDEELSRLKAADRSVEEACGVAELQFESVLAELRQMSLI